MIQSLAKLFERDLDLLAQEVSAYQKEEKLWELSGSINNTAGNLCLHLCGNLQFFIGNVLGKSGYKRNREAEFNDKDIPTGTLLSMIQETKKAVSSSLYAFDPNLLEMEYPMQVFGKPMTTSFFLIHLAGHLNYHLGQINYHRRLLDA